MKIEYDLTEKVLIIALENDKITWEEYAQMVPEKLRPHEYINLASFTKNKGKASKRIFKEEEWEAHAFRNQNI